MEPLEDFLKASGGCGMQLYHVVSESQGGAQCIPIKRADMQVKSYANRPLSVLLPLLIKPLRTESPLIHPCVTPTTLQFSAPTAYHHDNTCELTFCAQAPVMSVGRAADIPTQVQQISSTCSKEPEAGVNSAETALASGYSKTQSELDSSLLRTLLEEKTVAASKGTVLQGQSELKDSRSVISDNVLPKQQNSRKVVPATADSDMLSPLSIQSSQYLSTVPNTTGSYSTVSCKILVRRCKGLPDIFLTKVIDEQMKDTRTTEKITNGVSKKLESKHKQSHLCSSLSSFTSKIVDSEYRDLQERDICPIVIAPLPKCSGISDEQCNSGGLIKSFSQKPLMKPSTEPLNCNLSNSRSDRPMVYSERRYMKLTDIRLKRPNTMSETSIYHPKKLLLKPSTEPPHHGLSIPIADMPIPHPEKEVWKPTNEPPHRSKPLTDMPILHPQKEVWKPTNEPPHRSKPLTDMPILHPEKEVWKPTNEPPHCPKPLTDMPILHPEKEVWKPTNEPPHRLKPLTDMPILYSEKQLHPPCFKEKSSLPRQLSKSIDEPLHKDLSKAISDMQVLHSKKLPSKPTDAPLHHGLCRRMDKAIHYPEEKPLKATIDHPYNTVDGLPIVTLPNVVISEMDGERQDSLVNRSEPFLMWNPLELTGEMLRPLSNQSYEIPIIISPKEHFTPDHEDEEHTKIAEYSKTKIFSDEHSTPATTEVSSHTSSSGNDKDKSDYPFSPLIIEPEPTFGGHTNRSDTPGLDVHVGLESQVSSMPILRIDNVFSLASPDLSLPLSASPWQQRAEVSPGTHAAARALWRQPPTTPEPHLTSGAPWRDPEETDTASSPSLSQTGELLGTFSASLEPEVTVGIQRAWWISDDDLMLSDIKEESEEFIIDDEKDHFKEALNEISTGVSSSENLGISPKLNSLPFMLKCSPKTPKHSNISQHIACQPNAFVRNKIKPLVTNIKQLNSDKCKQEKLASSANSQKIRNRPVFPKRYWYKSPLPEKSDVKATPETCHLCISGGTGDASQEERDIINADDAIPQIPCSFASLKCLFQDALPCSEDEESPGESCHSHVHEGAGDAPRGGEESKSTRDMISQVPSCSSVSFKSSPQDSVHCSDEPNTTAELDSWLEGDCLQWVCDAVGNRYLLKIPATMQKWMTGARGSDWKLQMSFGTSPDSVVNTESPSLYPSQTLGCTKDNAQKPSENESLKIVEQESNSSSASDVKMKPKPSIAHSVMIRIKNCCIMPGETKPACYQGVAKVMVCLQINSKMKSNKSSPKKHLDLKRRVLLDAVRGQLLGNTLEMKLQKLHPDKADPSPQGDNKALYNNTIPNEVLGKVLTAQGTSNDKREESSKTAEGSNGVLKESLNSSASDASVNIMEDSSIERLEVDFKLSPVKDFDSETKAMMKTQNNEKSPLGEEAENFPPDVRQGGHSVPAECQETGTSGSKRIKTQPNYLQAMPQSHQCPPNESPLTEKIHQNEIAQFLWTIKSDKQVSTRSYVEKKQIANCDDKSACITILSRTANKVLGHLFRTQDGANCGSKEASSTAVTSDGALKVPRDTPHTSENVTEDPTIKKLSVDINPSKDFDSKPKAMMHISKCEKYLQILTVGDDGNAIADVCKGGDSRPSEGLMGSDQMTIDNTQYLEYMCQRHQWPPHEPYNYMRTEAEQRIRKLKDLKREQEEDIEKLRCAKKQKLSNDNL